MKDAQLKRIGMFSGMPMNGSDTPLQSGSVEFNHNSMATITPPGSSSGSGIDPEELFPGTSDTGTVPPTPEAEPGPGEDVPDPDPVEPGGEPGDGEELELVKEKPKKQQNDKRHKIVRLALLAGAAFIAYRLFFKRR